MTGYLRRALRAITPSSMLVWHLDRELELQAAEAAKLSRELAAELAENERLLNDLASVRRLLAAATAAAQPCVCATRPGSIEFWQRQAEQDRRNARRLEDLLARAEGRPVIGSLA